MYINQGNEKIKIGEKVNLTMSFSFEPRHYTRGAISNVKLDFTYRLIPKLLYNSNTKLQVKWALTLQLTAVYLIYLYIAMAGVPRDITARHSVRFVASFQFAFVTDGYKKR
jgi:hypothetical protein